MPRKVKTGKPPLQFLERSLGGARVPNGPEVRAALNPKDFFSDRPDPDTTALGSWVSPQFQTSPAAAAPSRRGRRRCQSAASVLDSKSSVCKFPSLTFKSRQPNQPRQPWKTSERPATSVRGGGARCSKGAASSSRCSIQPEAPSGPVEHRGRSPDGVRGGSERASSGPLLLLLPGSSPPPRQPPDILVADTPERDYGLKVTWRRRKALMAVMKAGGHLSDSDVLIPGSCGELARRGGDADISTVQPATF